MNRQKVRPVILLATILLLVLLSGCADRRVTPAPSGADSQRQTGVTVAPPETGENPGDHGQLSTGALSGATPAPAGSSGAGKTGAGPATAENTGGGLVKSSSKLSDPQAEAALQQLDSQLQQLESELEQMDDVLDEDTAF